MKPNLIYINAIEPVMNGWIVYLQQSIADPLYLPTGVVLRKFVFFHASLAEVQERIDSEAYFLPAL